MGITNLEIIPINTRRMKLNGWIPMAMVMVTTLAEIMVICSHLIQLNFKIRMVMDLGIIHKVKMLMHFLMMYRNGKTLMAIN